MPHGPEGTVMPASWTTEAELVDLLESVISAETPSRNRHLRVWREFPTGAGLVDLLAVRYDPRILDKRLHTHERTGAGNFELVHGYAMAYLQPRRWISTDELGAQLRIGLRETGRITAVLVGRGLVEAKADQVRALPLRDVMAVRSIDAYEAKLTKWRKVAEQAFRHLWFASRSHVAMPRLGEAVREQVQHLCDRWRLGLWLCDSTTGWSKATGCTVGRTPSTQISWWLNEQLLEEHRSDDQRTPPRRCA